MEDHQTMEEHNSNLQKLTKFDLNIPTIDEETPIDEDIDEDIDEELQPHELPTINLESNTVDWEQIEVDAILRPFETFNTPTIVADEGPSKEYDWTPHFPKDLVLASRDKMREWVNDFGRKNKMVLVVKKSDYKGRNPRVIYQCDRGGKYKVKKGKENSTASLTKKRDTGTRKCGCLFEVKFIQLYGDDKRWKFESVKCGTHNHSLASYVEGQAYHARLSGEEKQVYKGLHEGGLKPKQALGVIKNQFPENTSSLQTLYNEKKKYEKVVRDGRSEFQELQADAATAGYVMHDRRDFCDDVVHDFFFAHQDCISLAKCFPQVFVMDCTYKTNIHNWPLFEIVGITSTGKSFPVCYTFLKQETTDHFIWALNCFKELLADGQVPFAIVTDKDQALMNALQIVFPDTPNLLCRWHIGMGIEKQGKKILPKEDDEEVAKKEGKEVYRPNVVEDFSKGWQAKLKEKYKEMWDLIVWSKTLDEYNTRLEELRQYFQEWPSLHEYALTWLEHKEKFVSVWTNERFHLGNTSTQRVEGAHGTLKYALLKTSRHTFLSMYRLIKNHLKIQICQIKGSFTESQNIQKHAIRLPFFRNVKGVTTTKCLKLLREEYDKAVKGFTEDGGCDCSIVVTHGLPCACSMGPLIREGGMLELDQIHDFWKKLSIIPRRVEYDELELHEEFQLWLANWRKSNSYQRKYLLRRLREDSSRQTTWLNTPLEPVQQKGRPTASKNKKDWSNKRNPSSFEIEEPSIPIPPSGQIYSQGPEPPKKRPRKLAPKKPTKSRTFLALRHHLPDVYEPYVDDIQDVEGDGNCGFRAVAVALGMDENTGWLEVRNDCVMELDRNRELYAKNFGGYEYVRRLRKIINWYHSPTLDTNKHWMLMPETGYVIANFYGKVLVFMGGVSPSYYTFCTFVPQQTSAPPRVKGQACLLPHIAIMHTPAHYVCVKLKPFAPIPPPTPISLKNRDPLCTGWDEWICARKEAFMSLFPEKFETIDIADKPIMISDSEGEEDMPVQKDMDGDGDFWDMFA